MTNTMIQYSDNTAVTTDVWSKYKTNRPAESKRLFVSKVVDKEIERVKGMLKNPKLAWMFENCFPNTLDT
ncbi:MAG TPA: metal-independent alpha-mannosidase, partial [Bacteroides coprosuis]|nr:metal-independent alpha-mannosidase [Bacteroides coprosuis]